MSFHCPNCEKEIPFDDAQFCYNCGAPLNGGEDEDDITRSVSEAEIIDDEVTRSVSEISDTDETTKPVSDIISADNHEDTRAVFETADISESTRPVPSAEIIPDDDAQKAEAPSKISEIAPLKEIEFEPGFILEDRYRLDEVLGQGGYGAVYLAEDIKIKRRCVVKQMLIQGRSRQDVEIYRANFKREADLLVELNDPGHPNIPEIFDYFSTDTGNYLVMKYIEGQNLKDVLEQSEDKIPWREAVHYATGVCSALDYMHTKRDEPILHRDIKPANILLGDDGRVWLVDFGLAKADPVVSVGGDQAATRASGSLGYTPLEQWFGRAVPASDIYALGVTLHHLVTGVSPLKAYNGKFSFKIIKDLHGQIPSICKSDPKLPKDLEKIVNRAVTAQPEERPTPLQLQQQLEALVSAAQATALFTFKNGESAQTVPELVDLCEENRQEAETYLYNGDFERWFLLINRNDLAEAASQAVKLGKNRHHGLEKFLKLILPNLLFRRLGKASRHLAYVAAQVLLITLAVVLFLAIGGSFGTRWFLQRTIGNADWDFYALDLGENHYSETFLSKTFNAAGYFDETEVDVSPLDKFKVTGRWYKLPFEASISTNLRLGGKQPRFHLAEINGIPLFLIGENISAGINAGIDDAFQKGPVDIAKLIVLEDEVVFWAEKSNDPNRPSYTPPPSPATSTSIPPPTPIPAGKTLVVVYNVAKHDIVLKIEGEGTWDITTNGIKVIELPSGQYEYIVQRKENSKILAYGTIIWNPEKAYRLRIGSEKDLSEEINQW